MSEARSFSVSTMFMRRLGLMLTLTAPLSCFSLTQVRVSHQVYSASTVADLEIWLDDRPIVTPSRDAAIAGLFLYPLDVFFSTLLALHAPFDSDLRIRGGPAGALAGIALPWVTLVGENTLLPSLLLWRPPTELDQTSFDQLIARIKKGEAVEAYRSAFKEYLSFVGPESLVEVSVTRLRPLEAAPELLELRGPRRSP